MRIKLKPAPTEEVYKLSCSRDELVRIALLSYKFERGDKYPTGGARLASQIYEQFPDVWQEAVTRNSNPHYIHPNKGV